LIAHGRERPVERRVQAIAHECGSLPAVLLYLEARERGYHAAQQDLDIRVVARIVLVDRSREEGVVLLVRGLPGLALP
jgi:hypothetical protein